MHRAAARGAIDFSAADLLDRKFWRRVGFVIRAIYEQDAAEVDKLEFQRAVAFMQAATIVKQESDSSISDYVEAALDRVRAWLQPWAAEERASRRRGVLREMEAEWASIWGDPDDPETQARIEETCRGLRGGG